MSEHGVLVDPLKVEVVLYSSLPRCTPIMEISWCIFTLKKLSLVLLMINIDLFAIMKRYREVEN